MTATTMTTTTIRATAATVDNPARAPRLRAAVLAAAALTIAAGITLAGTSPAFAHDELVASSPEPGEVFETAPAEVVLDFSGDIIEAGTVIEVVDHHGGDVAIGDPVIAGPQVTATLPADLEGEYQVRWRAVSADGHPIEGTIDFGVGADATGVWVEEPPHTDETDGAAADEQEGDDAAAETTGAEPWMIAAAVLGGLALIAVIAAVIVKSRRKAPGAE